MVVHGGTGHPRLKTDRTRPNKLASNPKSSQILVTQSHQKSAKKSDGFAPGPGGHLLRDCGSTTSLAAQHVVGGAGGSFGEREEVLCPLEILHEFAVSIFVNICHI